MRTLCLHTILSTDNGFRVCLFNQWRDCYMNGWLNKYIWSLQGEEVALCKALSPNSNPQPWSGKMPRLTWLWGAVLSISNLTVATERTLKISVQAASERVRISQSLQAENKGHVCKWPPPTGSTAGPPSAPCSRSLPCFSDDALHTWVCRSLHWEGNEEDWWAESPHLHRPGAVTCLPASLTRSTRGQSGCWAHQLLSLGHRPGASVRKIAGVSHWWYPPRT